MKQRIEKILKDELNPDFLEVKNNSHLHAGHLGDNGSGQTHFAVEIKSGQLSAISKIAAHRKINALLKDEFNKGLHALEIKIIPSN